MPKTTLVLDHDLVRLEALRRGTTISSLVESALRLFLLRPSWREELPALPSFDSGGALVDIGDRDPLYWAMEEH